MLALSRRTAPAAALFVLWLLLAVAVVDTQVEIANPVLAEIVGDYLFNLGQVGCALVLIWRGFAIKAERAAWLVFGFSMLAWCAGNVIYTFVLGDEVPVPSAADAAWLGAYPGLYLGLWLLFRARTADVARSSILDGAVAGLAVAAVCAAVLVEALRSGFVDAGLPTVATNLAYPVADLILLALVTAAMVAVGHRPSWSWALLAGGLFAFGVGDSIYLWESATGSTLTTLTPVMWTFGLALMAVGAWLPARPTPVRRSGIGSLTLLLTGAVLALALLAAGSTVDIGRLGTVLAVSALAVVLVRLVLTHVDNLRLVSRLHHDATTDALTGLSNRRRLLDDLQQVVDAASLRPSALIVFDLDGFKAFNDRMGHLEGDALLTRIGQRLAGAVKGVGSTYRMGGDEFCAIVAADGDDPLEIAARYTFALSEDHPDVPITCSAGAALIPDDAGDARMALLIADGRMYANKAARRTGRRDGDVVRLNPESAPDLAA